MNFSRSKKKRFSFRFLLLASCFGIYELVVPPEFSLYLQENVPREAAHSAGELVLSLPKEDKLRREEEKWTAIH
jgi:hypothetical protein